MAGEAAQPGPGPVRRLWMHPSKPLVRCACHLPCPATCPVTRRPAVGGEGGVPEGDSPRVWPHRAAAQVRLLPGQPPRPADAGSAHVVPCYMRPGWPAAPEAPRHSILRCAACFPTLHDLAMRCERCVPIPTPHAAAAAPWAPSTWAWSRRCWSTTCCRACWRAPQSAPSVRSSKEECRTASCFVDQSRRGCNGAPAR